MYVGGGDRELTDKLASSHPLIPVLTIVHVARRLLH